MKISKFGRHAVSVCKLIVLLCAIVGSASVAHAQYVTITPKPPTTAYAAAVLLDKGGRLIGVAPIKTFTIDRTAATARLAVLPRRSPPPNVEMSPLAPAFSDTPEEVLVTVPASLAVGFCASGDYYDRQTALCADGKPPYKIVPVISLGEPAAEIPNLICDAPKVPTFNSSTKKWACIVPAGFKLTM